MPPGVGMAWILVNVSPKISSQSAGWIARVYSSVRSWRILRSSTQHSVTMRLASRRSTAGGVSAGSPSAGLAETAGGTPGAANVTDASLLGVVVERAAGVVAEYVVQRGPGAEHGLEHARGAGGPDRARVHERDPVAVGVGLVHVVGGHQHGDRRGLAQAVNEIPDIRAGDRVQPDGRLVEDQQAGRADQLLRQLQPPDHAAGIGLDQA